MRAAGPRHAADRRVLRRRRWQGSWRAAIRLAYRDSWRHRGSSALIMVMIGLPVLLISGASGYLATTAVTAAEAVPVSLGSAEAKIIDVASGPLVQNADGTQQAGSDALTQPPFAGREPGTPWTAAQLSALTGQQVRAVGYPVLLAEQGAELRRLSSLATDDVMGSGLATAVTGRLPAAPDEVAVTGSGEAAGLPTSGLVVLRGPDGVNRTVQVVGVARAQGLDYRPVDVVGDSSWLDGETSLPEFLVRSAEPVSWADVRAWNGHGLVVLSRSVLQFPRLAAGETSITDDDALGQALVVGVCLALVLETTLLAGPAFAVSAARRRRSLALIGSNGADQAQLTRYVVAQGLVLGGLATALGGLVGTAAGWGVVAVQAAVAWGGGRPPLDAYAALTGLVMLAAVAAALLAASLPARGAARLALAGVLTGQDRRPPSSRAALAGAGVVALGGAAVVVSAVLLRSSAQLYLGVFGGALMVLGALPCIAPVLTALAALLGRGPVPLRMAAREASRSHRRTASAVAATMVAVAVLTILTTANTSDDAQQRRDYVAQTVLGQGTIAVYERGVTGMPDAGPAVQQIRRQHPDWRLEARGHLGTEYRDGSGTGDVVAAVAPGCSAAQAIVNADKLDLSSAAGSCVVLGSNDGSDLLLALPVSALGPEVGLTADQRAVLDRGGMLVTEASVLRGARVQLAVGTYQRPRGTSRQVVREVGLPAALLQQGQADALVPSWGGGLSVGLVLTATAERLDLPVATDEWAVTDPSGPISRAEEEAVNERADSQLRVERGYESSVGTLVLVLTGIAAALVAVAALISTALAQVEARADLTTMASLGASAGFRRRLAGAQALVVALTGAVLGVALGLGPGITVAVAFTTDTGAANGAPFSTPDAVVVIPWVGLAVVVVAVPLLAAAVAALAVRSSPTMTGRAT